ncbi:hypothetical protein [Accumulibacter sp.]|uniref:hypothetical protein n=1 Tax=Accumulibacter sp. TaxID=2053492 RepID=UPI0025D621E9|nr:hypothetical protein [Accumulibacter sp.]MCM8614134.1 hypothetical protein [Accumulibacter sp.]MCM8637842.1 hypothetical protein [Accumulibacter sp.]MCM8641249.1 hypothetical protein [Accumulibacter sp.]
MASGSNIANVAPLAVQEVRFEGGILQRGFWLYVWEVMPAGQAPLYYVGRTGDSSSTNAQSPFNRMGQHLGFARNSNMLRRHLMQRGAVPESCAFRLIALGPIEQEARAPGRREHDQRRDLVAAMEKALAELLASSGLQVMNRVVSRKPLDEARFAQVRAAFARAFPQLVAARR